MRMTLPQVLDRRLPVAVAGSAALIALGLAFTPAHAADADTPVPLGTTEQFAVLAGAGITNTGATTIEGDIGSHPTPAEVLVGVELDGTNQADNEVTQLAKDALVAAYVDAEDSSRPVEDPTELGGRTLTAGIYGNATELGLTGALTLTGDSDDVFVFQAGSTLITASGSSVVLAGDVQACNVFWQVGSSATFGTDTSFVGTVMALTDISAQQGASFDGRLLARNGAVTLINNTIAAPFCADDGDDTGGSDDGGTGGDDGGSDDDGTGTDDGGSDDGGTGGDDGGPDVGGTDGGDADGGGAGGDADADGIDVASDGGAGVTDSSSGDGASDGTTSTNGTLPAAGGSTLWLLAAGLGALGLGSALTWNRRERGRHSS